VRSHLPVLVIGLVLLVLSEPLHAQSAQGVVDDLLGKYQSAGQSWASTLRQAAINLFWMLALISLGWTLVSMGIKQAELMEIVAELCRYIMVTGLFFWLLTNGPTFAHDIVSSLWTVGGNAAGGGQQLHPGDLVNLGMQLFQAELKQINILLPAATGIPVAIALIILIVCALTAVNIILLLCASWIVIYAGLILLGFGGCRWTSDMAINYYHSVLGIGVSLMTMQLIIGLGVSFLKALIDGMGPTPDAGQIAIVMVATIILCCISHRVPHMVAGMVVGSGHHGTVGGIGVMSLVGAGVAGASIVARGAAGGPAGVAGGAGAMAAGGAADQLQQRIASAEAAMAVEGGSNSMSAGAAGSSPSWNGGTSSVAAPGAGKSGLLTPRGGGQRVGQTRSAAGSSLTPQATGAASTQQGSPNDGGATPSQAVVSEPELDRPITPDEARGFGQDGNGVPTETPV
jgi:type IV secretion system protein TrbL